MTDSTYRVSYYTRTGSHRITRHIVPLPDLPSALIRAVREWHRWGTAGPVMVWQGSQVIRDPEEVERIAVENWEEV